tara:strand:+ start:1166 stop:1333 length:168 start_codon:yes stop_codon:yes gene_type:complete
MSYIKGTNLEALIDRTVDGWAKILGFTETEEDKKKETKPKSKNKKKRKKVKRNEQ